MRGWFFPSATDPTKPVSHGTLYLTDVLTRIVNGHPNRDIEQLLPWAYKKQELKAVA